MFKKEGVIPLASIDEAIGILQSEVNDDISTCHAIDVISILAILRSLPLLISE